MGHRHMGDWSCDMICTILKFAKKTQNGRLGHQLPCPWRSQPSVSHFPTADLRGLRSSVVRAITGERRAVGAVGAVVVDALSMGETGGSLCRRHRSIRQMATGACQEVPGQVSSQGGVYDAPQNVQVVVDVEFLNPQTAFVNFVSRERVPFETLEFSSQDQVLQRTVENRLDPQTHGFPLVPQIVQEIGEVHACVVTEENQGQIVQVVKVIPPEGTPA